MARNIGATLSLNNGNFFTNMKSAVAASNNLRTSLGSATGGMKTFSSQSSSTGNVLTSLASKAVVVVSAFAGISKAVNFGKDVVNTGLEFEQGMANVSAISGTTGAELTALSEKAKQMGATTKFSALEASDAMSYMAMAGWNSSQMIDGIAGIMNLAAASGEELASVSDIVTDSLTAFGLKASDSAEFADILAVASSKSNTNVSMLGESFKNVAPTAGAMGYSVRDTTVALGLMANAGIKGGAAGTSLNSVMTRLAKPTKDVTTALSALNIQVTNTDGSMKPLSTLIPELQTKFASLSDAEKGQYATMIAGKNAMSGFLSIVNSSPSDFEALTDAINNSEGAAQSMADTMNDTVSGKLTLLKSQFEGVKIAIFDALGSSQFKGVLQSVSDGLSAITPYVTTLSVAIGNGLFNAIQTIYNIASTVFGAVKTAVENNQPAIERLTSAFDNVRNTLINAFSGNGVDLIQTLANVIIPTLCNALSGTMNIAAGLISVGSKISPIIAGIAGAVMAYKIAVTAANVVEGIRNGLIAFSAVMTGTQAAAFAPLTTATIAQIAATSALNVVTGLFGAVMTFVTSPIGLVVLAIGAVIAIGVLLYKHWDTVKEFAMNLWNSIVNIFNGIKNAISNAWNGVKETAANIWGGIKNTVSEKLNNIKNAYQEHGGGIKGVAAGAMEAVKGYYSAGYEALNKVTGGKLGRVVDGVKSKLNNIKNVYNEHGGGLKGVVAATMEGVKGYYAAGFNVLNNLTGGKLGQVVSGVKEKLAPMAGAVKERLAGVKAAFTDNFNTVKNAVVKIVTSIREAIASVVSGIRNVIGAIVGGIKTYVIGTVENIRATITNIVGGVRQNFANFFQSIQGAFQGVWNGIKTVFDGIKTTISGVFQFIVGIFTFNTDTIHAGIQTIKDGFTTAFEGAKQVVLNVWNAIVSAATFAFENIRTVVGGVIGGVRAQIENVRNTASRVFTSVWNTISNTFENVKSKVISVFDGVKSIISTAINTIKGFFRFNWELPKIKLPHFNITGSFSLNPPQAPSFGIEWYRQGGIMTRPTIFGMNGSVAMAGGEAGAEAILPLTQFWNTLHDYLKPQPISDRPNVTNYIDVKVYSNGEDEDMLADKVAKRIVEAIENM